MHQNPLWHIGFKEITAPTNERTFITAALPAEGFGNKVPLILFGEKKRRQISYLLLTNLSTFVFDFATRQKIHGQTLNYFIVKQLPVLPPETYEKPFKGRDIRPWIRDRVLELTYTAEDMRPFAEDLGYAGDPYTWDDERRLHLRCQLDALYFHLYNINKEEIGYILDTFPIVRNHDQKTAGHYRTKDLIQSYWTAYNAGDLDAEVRS